MKCWPFSERVGKNNSYDDQLHEECIWLAAYLVHLKPSKYIREKYIDAHRSAHLHVSYVPNKFDEFLLVFAKKHMFCMKLADIYTAMFVRTSLLRKKMILLLAILESCAETYTLVDGVKEYSKLAFYTRCFLQCLVFSFFLAVSLLIFAPPHLVASFNSETRILPKNG